MSLFGMLGTTSRALEVQRFGLDVVGNNLANVNTPGYTKRVADFGAIPPPDRFSAGNGVEVLGVRSMRDRLYDQRLFDESPLEQQQSAMADALGLAEVALGRAGQLGRRRPRRLLRCLRRTGRRADVADGTPAGRWPKARRSPVRSTAWRRA